MREWLLLLLWILVLLWRLRASLPSSLLPGCTLAAMHPRPTAYVHLAIYVYPAGTTDPKHATNEARALCADRGKDPLTDVLADVTCPDCREWMGKYL